MTAVSQVNTSPSSIESKQLPSTVDYEVFLKLLVAEMQAQDPTNPMESSEYVAQLASFSNVEQGVQINAKLDSLLSATAFETASNAIGKFIASASGESGVVAGVRVIDGAPVAVLEDGREIAIAGDYTLREPKA